MSINALKEFMIHFHTYRNVDLINQGLYQIRARVYYLDNNIKYYAIPYFYSDSKGSESLYRSEESNIRPHNIIPNHISENNWEYVTKTFLIRYYDEEVEIDEFCYFRIEIASNFLKKKILYQIEFELFFSDALLALENDKKSSNNLSNNLNNYSSNNNVLNNVEFKSASCQTSYINYDEECPGYIESFNPVVYGDSFFSILNTSVHMIILDYKLRLNNFSAYSSNGVNTLWGKDVNEKDKEYRKSFASNKNEKINLNTNNNKDNPTNNNTSTKKEKNLGKIDLKEDLTSNYNSNTKSLNDKNFDSNLNNYYSNNSNNNFSKDVNKNVNNNNKNAALDLITNKAEYLNENLNSLIQFFINDKIIKLTDSILSPELVDELYDCYVFGMIKNYFSIRKKYERLMHKLIDDKIKSDFPFFIVNHFPKIFFQKHNLSKLI